MKISPADRQRQITPRSLRAGSLIHEAVFVMRQTDRAEQATPGELEPRHLWFEQPAQRNDPDKGDGLISM
jgi:hypothetical protein